MTFKLTQVLLSFIVFYVNASIIRISWREEAIAPLAPLLNPLLAIYIIIYIHVCKHTSIYIPHK